MFVKTPRYCESLIITNGDNNKAVVIDMYGNEVLKTDIDYSISNMGITITNIIDSHNRDLKLDLYILDYYELQYSLISIKHKACIIVMLKSDHTSKHVITIQE